MHLLGMPQKDTEIFFRDKLSHFIKPVATISQTFQSILK